MSKPGQCIRCGKPVGEHEAVCSQCKANTNQPEKVIKISRWWCIPLALAAVADVIALAFMRVLGVHGLVQFIGWFLWPLLFLACINVWTKRRFF
jgi:predicted nucleic acid-binding Zn ribbon protein